MHIGEWMNVWKLVSAVGMEADISERFYVTIQTYYIICVTPFSSFVDPGQTVRGLWWTSDI
jgi:hypothetical protein